MVSLRLLAVLLVLAAVTGGLLGALAFAFVLDDDEPRGEVLRLYGSIETYHEIETTPFCVSLQHYCLIRQDDGEVRALYTYDTHDSSRIRSCEIEWRQDMRFQDPVSGETSTGWFRSGCSGTTYRYNGERVFGPGPRDMDSFPLRMGSEVIDGPDGETFEVQYIELDTWRLVCGEPVPGAPAGCKKAPAPQ